MTSMDRPILVVEDSDEDFTITEWAFKKIHPDISLVRCKDGEKAIEYLQAAGTARLPAIVLLDLNLPRTNGHQVLRHIKTCERLMRLPVIVFSSSSNQEDVRACYRNGANSYLTKPVGMTRCLDLFQGLTQYWLRLSTLPEIREGD